MQQLMGVVNLDHELDLMNELTYFRCGAAVPFAGRYRLIDFVLSNMMHSGVHNIALFVRRKYRSLMDHLGEGAPWDLDRKHGGLFILPPDWNDPTDRSKGDLQHFHNNRDFFLRGSGTHIIHTGSQHLYTVDYREMFNYHLETQADITLLYKRADEILPEYESSIRMDVDNGWVTGMHGEGGHPNIYLGAFIIEKQLFLKLIDHCIAHGHNHFFRDGIQNNLANLKIAAYAYTGYHAVINSVDSYYRNSLELLQQEQYNKLFKYHEVHTKIKYEPPTRYLEQAEVHNSLIANGCVIGGTVENSIIFRGVKIHNGAQIHNSIIMQKCVIEENAVLENVILDKDVHLSVDRRLIGDAKKPYVIAKSSQI
ncbi:glucose-1-phosphate adenylyltransferase subunit GlgD [Paenibacillus urinalis]|uniref:Glucose-1-phosphate adenylyltransferase subunit GlgD n=1 Tax=Paenibacillus urinalis TaxID=521520 RepID=A0AAX3N4M0_9BACL|nr:glucose-1-phosphate adenylyltransferase subunit GlgD [Paenibacillus urinalis]WDH84701.1 glucose-1-phosphate adenylyltransferase subunit GlgD [Paenibacillus urinalis]WDH96160.1 glucose-1-phosphate adenylyltransferase subunit GlgD [Paenibacillus urinalis]WDI04383.1 glucose-1-phosphate adenylyltransferase subunit GlgD [Paenibacillus urinalis]